MRLLVTGAGGILGRAAVGAARARGWQVRALDRAALDVTDADATAAAVADAAPQAILHCAAYTAVDGAEAEVERALAVNRDGTGNVARASASAGALLIYPSTDYVFDGTKGSPYLPDDAPRPLSAYGRSKLAGEEEARRSPRHLVARTSWLYGAGGRNFVDTILTRAEQGGALRVVDDQRGRPTWTASLARSLLDLVERDERGVFHVCDGGDATWFDLASEAVRLAGLHGVEVEPVASTAWEAAAPRPEASVLDLTRTERVLGRPSTPWRESLARYVDERRAPSKGAASNA